MHITRDVDRQAAIMTASSLGVAIGDSVLLHDVNLNVCRGELILVTGPNGSGKSTLLRALASEIPTCDGSLYVQPGALVVRLDDNPPLYDLLTVREHLEFFAKIAAAEVDLVMHMRKARIDHLAQSFGRDLSTGERRRLSLSLVLLVEPVILLLDEPYNGLDDESVKDLNETIIELRKEGLACVLVTHDPSRVSGIISQQWRLHSGTVSVVTS